MPAAPSVDLAALDALFAAATPGPYRVDYPADYIAGDPVSIFDADDLPVADLMSAKDAALIAALHNAWPSLKRDLEIGRAAVEVVEAERLLAALYQSNIVGLNREQRDELDLRVEKARFAIFAARRRYEGTCRAG